MKYLHLEFKNAGIINNNKKPDDWIYDLNTIKTSNNKNNKDETKGVKRENSELIPEIITVNNISNVLHVLCGLPPVASYRTTIFEKNDKLYDAASNSYVKINKGHNLNIYGKTYFELFNGKKLAYNSKKVIINEAEFSDGIKRFIGIHTWVSWKCKLHDDELFNELSVLLSDILKTDNLFADYTLIDAMTSLSYINDDIVKNRLNEFGEKLLKKRAKPLYNILLNNLLIYNVNDKKMTDTNINCNKSRYPLLINNSIKEILTINGEIIIPIDDDIVDAISEYYRPSTILDGGIVYIKCLEDFIPTDDILKLKGWFKVGDNILNSFKKKKKNEINRKLLK